MSSVLALALFFLLSVAIARNNSDRRTVRCDRGADLIRELQRNDNRYLIEIRGVCHVTSSVVINDDFIHLLPVPGYTASIIADDDFPVVRIEGASRIILERLTISGGSVGVTLSGQAAVLLNGTTIENNLVGIDITGNSLLEIDDVTLTNNVNAGITGGDNSALVAQGDFTITGTTGGFAVALGEGTSFKLRPNAHGSVSGNFFGVQVTGSGHLFLDTASSLDISSNSLIGLSINVGATMSLFRADVTVSGNGLDGASITLGSSLFVDQTCSFVANNNGRDGIRLEQGILRVNNLAGPPPNLGGLLQTNNNVRRGFSLGRGSFLDLQASGPIRGLQSSGNLGDSDLWIDYESKCTLRSSTVDRVIIGFGSVIDTASSTVNSFTCADTSVRTRGSLSCP